MTLNELKNEVLSLMFETELDSHSAFVFAANRALMEIHSERDRTKTVSIYKKRTKPLEVHKKLSHIGGTDISLHLSGKAFSLTAVGIGKLLFTDGKITEEIEFSGTSTVIKRIIGTGAAFLSFTGDFSYEIYNLASFASLNSDKADDIPLFSELESFDMKKIDPLFLAFSDMPKDSSGRNTENVRLEGSFITLPSEFEGELIISYKIMPRRILENELDTELDISPECEHLLPLRCAAYLLLDDNEGLAEYYSALYKRGMSAVKLYNRKETNSHYEDVHGWA